MPLDGNIYDCEKFPKFRDWVLNNNKNKIFTLYKDSTKIKLPDFTNRTIWGADSPANAGKQIEAGLPNIKGIIHGVKVNDKRNLL